MIAHTLRSKHASSLFLGLLLAIGYLPLCWMTSSDLIRTSHRIAIPVAFSIVLTGIHFAVDRFLVSFWRASLAGLLSGYIAGVIGLVLASTIVGLGPTILGRMLQGSWADVEGLLLIPLYMFTPAVGVAGFILAQMARRFRRLR
jgi:hypothetical protein